MAKNLQSKLSTSDTVRLYDINRDVMQRLAGEMKTSSKADTTGGAAVELAESGEAASAGAVSDLVAAIWLVVVTPYTSKQMRT